MGPLFRRVNISSGESPALLSPSPSPRCSSPSKEEGWFRWIRHLERSIRKKSFSTAAGRRKKRKSLRSPSSGPFITAGAVFPLERRASLVPTPGENIFNRLEDALFFADNGRGRMQEWLSNLQTCLHKAKACFSGPTASAAAGCRSLGLQASHIGRVVVGDMCRNYM